MMEIGRICMKTAGRERGKVCVIVDILDENFVLIDGNVKRRRCNIDHLEPTPKKLDINKGARTETILKALKEAGYE
ncbi:50S ribosomal protein L14e, partial [Nanoarchaeota archaeon]